VAQRVGAQGLYDAMRRFGYGERTGLGLPGESRGVLPAPADWSGTSIATIPIGQGVSVNVMQVASVYATVANGGVRVTPTVIKAVADASVTSYRHPPAATRRVISPEVAAQLRMMLEAVVSAEGTGPLAAVPGYRIAGKTGTAQRSWTAATPPATTRARSSASPRGCPPPRHGGRAGRGPADTGTSAVPRRPRVQEHHDVRSRRAEDPADGHHPAGRQADRR